MKKVCIISAYKKEEFDEINRVCFDYVKSVENTGIAIPFIVPCNTNNVDYYVDQFDYFIIPGGDDIDPSLYGQNINGTRDFNTENDKKNLEFIDKIIKKGKKILGICRGMQLINIYFGGTLIQDIKHSDIHYDYKNQYQSVHNIKIDKASILYKIFQKEILGVNSIHHQAVDVLGKNLLVSSNDIENGYIESIESSDGKILGVQWHPENLDSHIDLFKYFLKK